MTITFDAIGIYDEAGYTYDGSLIGVSKRSGRAEVGMVRADDDHGTAHVPSDPGLSQGSDAR